jgi:hypothetical protein
MATASQKITLIKFFDLILGILMAEPKRLLPVMKIPLDGSDLGVLLTMKHR